MNPIKQLAGQTAIYGFSSIVGRLLNYFLVPLYTRIFLPAEYGNISNIYAYVSFLLILFTYGMETAYFRFAQTENEPNVFSTTLISLFVSSIMLGGIIFVFAIPISNVLQYHNHSEYIKWFAMILALDAISAIPFAKLRYQNQAKRFAIIKFINIGSNIGLNIFFLIICPYMMRFSASPFYIFIKEIYNPAIGIGYVFVSNLLASILTLVLLLPEMLNTQFRFDSVIWKRMMVYSLPLLIAGFAGMTNETMDRIMIPYLYPDKSLAFVQNGIYGACYKLSIMMTLFIQTFRFAAEPFFFAHAKNENSRQVYADVMKYFVIICSFIFLGIMLYIDIFKYFVGEKYWEGLKVVPILLLANLCLGVFFNLSIWFKLTGHTQWGAYLAMFGAAITLILNFWWIPIMGYMGSAWATLICYGSMMIISYIIGHRYFPVNYDLKKLLGYLGFALALYGISWYMHSLAFSRNIVFPVNTLLLLIFIGTTAFIEIPLLRNKL